MECWISRHTDRSQVPEENGPTVPAPADLQPSFTSQKKYTSISLKSPMCHMSVAYIPNRSLVDSAVFPAPWATHFFILKVG